ncbi:Uncharacterised protein [Mycobacteroides abscessus subsp. abscessus]|nr:Uncharacterised protein [Mycobacteroides abscessus subsp. abscessus]
MHQAVDDQRDRRRDEQVGQHEAVERQVEGEEAEVQSELRILDTEVPAFQEQLHRHPIALGHNTGQYADKYGNTDEEEPHPRQNQRPVLRQRVTRPLGGHEHGASTVRQPEAGENHGSDQCSNDQEQRETSQQHGGEHTAEAELTKPQPVDVGVDQARPDQQQHHNHQRRGDQSPAPSGQSWQSPIWPHSHVATLLVECY